LISAILQAQQSIETITILAAFLPISADVLVAEFICRAIVVAATNGRAFLVQALLIDRANSTRITRYSAKLILTSFS
jgi:hypothetical protein